MIKDLRVVFHVTDRCNLRCRGCHWFSSPVKECKELSSEVYLKFLSRYSSKIKTLRISGGEPTLYYGFLALVNRIPEDIFLIVNTNGTNLNALRKLSHKNLKLTVSVNRPVHKNFEADIKSLGKKVDFVSFNDENYIKNVIKIEDETAFQGRDLINRKGICQCRDIRFGTDGWAYFCEKGLRSKSPLFRCSFSLFSGEPKIESRECCVTEDCISNLCSENFLVFPETLNG